MSDPSPSVGRDVGVVLGGLLVVGLVAGVVWGLVVDTPEVTRDAAGLVTAGPELARQVDADAWFALLGILLVTPCGVLVASWRRLDPVAGVLLVVAGAVLASGVARLVGGIIGPGDPAEVLRAAEVGATAAAPLTTHTWVVYAVWPLAAALGCLVTLLLRPPSR